jgi:hypothetical protein
MSTVTVTGKIGPGNTVTSLVFSGVINFSIDTVNEVIEITYLVNNERKIQQVEITSATTITCTVSGNNYTLTIS